MTPDKNRPSTSQTEQEMTEQVNNPNSSSYRPNWIIPEREKHRNDRENDQQRNQQDNTSSEGNDETLGIP